MNAHRVPSRKTDTNMKSISTKQLDDQTILKYLQSANESEVSRAIDTLYASRTVQTKVRTMAKDYNLRHAEPEDILQDAMLLLYKASRPTLSEETGEITAPPVFRGQCKVETFLIGIARNMIRTGARYGTQQRDGKRIQRVEFRDSITDQDFASASDVSEWIVLLDQHELAAKRDARLHEVMQQLTEKCKERLALQYFENRNMAEIAAATDLANPRQATNAAYDCRQQLRRLIERDTNLMEILMSFE